MNTQINTLNFKGQNIYVGIDVHLKSWSVIVLSETSLVKKFSKSPNPDALHKFLVANYPGRVTVRFMKLDFVDFGYMTD